MILNVSPLAASLGESLCSLRFATKVSMPLTVFIAFGSHLLQVNNTTIGTAKRQIKKDAS
jgi:kinesin family protein C1